MITEEAVVALPDTGDGSRSRRRRSKRRRRLGTGAVAALVVPALLVLGSALGPSGSGDVGTNATATIAPPSEHAGTVALLLHRDGGGALVGASVFTVGPRGVGGDVLHVPTDLLVETRLGSVTLREAASEGDAIVVSLVENALGRPVDAHAVLNPSGLAAAILPAGDLVIDLAEGGRATVSPSGLSSLLEAEAPSGLARLVRYQAVWSAWLSAIGDRPEAAPDASTLGAVASVVAAIARGEVGHDVVPVEAVASADGQQRYRLRGEELDAVLARLLPDTPAYTACPTAQLLDGTGAAAAAAPAIAAIVRAGGRVTSIGTADPAPDVSTILFYGDDDRKTAGAVAKAVGAGRVEKGTGPHVADLVVVLGGDFDSGVPQTSTSSTEGAFPADSE